LKIRYRGGPYVLIEVVVSHTVINIRIPLLATFVSKTVGVLIGHEHLRFVDEGVLRFFITYEDHCIGLVYLLRVNGVQPRNCIVD